MTGHFTKHIIITGSARSGTSWLSEIIGRQFRYRLLFEPEHEFNTKKGILIADQWIKNEKDSPKAHQYLKKVFANRVDCNWIAQLSNRTYKRHLWPFIPKKYIFKFVRANLSAGYMNASFQIPVIHIVRNPYDVLKSQQRVKFPWLYNLDHFKNQSDLVALIKKEFDFDLNQMSNLSSLEMLTVRWCVENLLPLQVFEGHLHNYQVIRYEDLLESTEVFLKLCADFDLDPMKNIEEEYLRPSSKTHPKSNIMDAKRKYANFNEDEIGQINGILDIFRCNLYPIRKFRPS